MKEIIKVTATDKQVAFRDDLRAIGTHIAAAICGFLSTRAVVAGNLMPFGLALLAGNSLALAPSIAAGVFVGYFFPPTETGAFRYLAALFAILAIKLLLTNYKRLVESPIFLSAIAGAATVLTAAVTLRGLPADILKLFAEGLLCAGATFFIRKTAVALETRPAGLSGDELAALLCVIGILLIGADRLSPGGVSLGRIAGVFLLLSAAKYGGTVAGACAGIAVAFSAVLSPAPTEYAATYALCGLAAGVFASYGKYAQIAVTFSAALAGAAAVKFGAQTVLFLIEALLGCTLFLAMPRSFGVRCGRIFSACPAVSVPNNVKKAVILRLDLAANALQDVSETVEQVSRELSRINAPDFSGVIAGIEQDACGGCKLRLHCWEKRRDDTVSAVLAMTKAVKDGEYTPESRAPEEFRGRCLRLQRLGNAVYRKYSVYAARTAAENRLDEVRSVVTDQFDGISHMLTDLARDFDGEERFDGAAALTAAAALKNIGIRVEECSSHLDRDGRMTLELKIRKSKEIILNKRQIMKLISLVCERDFDVPNISEVGGEVFITLSEHAAFSAQIGAFQIAANGNELCGDAYQYFNDGRGHLILVLSDGMGTGGRAAVDGAMASGLMSRLLKAGFGYDCSLRILNSSMLFKSTDESLATVDIASIDLYNGNAELYKAGAAPTLVRRSGRTGKAESTSLPAGILRDIGFDRAGVRLHIGDILLLLSDGAVSEGTDWIARELENWQDGSAQDLAEHICECARRRRSDQHEDDVTVLAAILEKAV